jgi:hypothetical protein
MMGAKREYEAVFVRGLGLWQEIEQIRKIVQIGRHANWVAPETLRDGNTTLRHTPSLRFFFALECALSSELLHKGDCAFPFKVARLLHRDGWRYSEVADETRSSKRDDDRQTPSAPTFHASLVC